MSTYSEKSAEQNTQVVDQSASMKGGCPFKAMKQLEKVMTSQDEEVHDIQGNQCNISSILKQCPYLHKICEPIDKDEKDLDTEFIIDNYEHDEKIIDTQEA